MSAAAPPRSPMITARPNIETHASVLDDCAGAFFRFAKKIMLKIKFLKNNKMLFLIINYC
jgi:hypothetical protein